MPDYRAFIRQRLSKGEENMSREVIPQMSVEPTKAQKLNTPSTSFFGRLAGVIGDTVEAVTGIDPVDSIKSFVSDWASKSRRTGILNSVMSKLGGKRYADPSALREPTEAERTEYNLPSSSTITENQQQAIGAAEREATRAGGLGILDSFNYHNQTPGQKVAAIATLPIRWTAGSLARATVGAALDIAGVDKRFVPESRLQEYLIGREDLRSWSKANDLYGVVRQGINTKLRSLGLNPSTARNASFGTTLLLAGILENPFMSFSSKAAKEGLERAIKEQIEKTTGRKLEKEGLQDLTRNVEEFVRLSVGEREKAASAYIARVTDNPADRLVLSDTGEITERTAPREIVQQRRTPLKELTEETVQVFRGSKGRAIEEATIDLKNSRVLQVEGDQMELLKKYAAEGDVEAKRLIPLSTGSGKNEADDFLRQKLGQDFDYLAYKKLDNPQVGIELHDLKSDKHFSTSKAEAEVYSLSSRGIGYQKPQEIIEPKLVPGNAPRTEVPPEVYEANRSVVAQSQKIMVPKGIMKGVQRTANEFLTAISYRLERIDPTLKTRLRKLEFNTSLNTASDLEPIANIIRQMDNMKAVDIVDLDLAMKNGDIKKVDEVAARAGLTEDVKKLRSVLDDLYERAKNAGYDFGYEKGYFPRRVKDTDGLMRYFYGSEDLRPVIEEAVQNKEKELGRRLSNEEKAILANSLLRGYQAGSITLSKKGSMLARRVDLVDSEINKFYYSTAEAIPTYIRQMNEAIEAKKFFGGSLKGLATIDNPNIKDSIGAYTMNLVADGKLDPMKEEELRAILDARFNAKGPGTAVGIFRDVSYIQAMGNFSSAISQLQDLANSLYRSGIFPTLEAAGKSFVNKSEVNVAELGLSGIAYELSNKKGLGNLVSTVFKIVGLEKLDRVGKETFVNSLLKSWRKLARGPLTENSELYKRLSPIFGGMEGVQRVVNDLRTGRITEDVKFALFNQLSDIQPVTMSEMPEKYLTSGNGRVFYMLKSFTLKQFENYRREIGQEWAKGNKMQAAQNAFKIGSFMLVMGATADEIKAWMYNRENLGNSDPENVAYDRFVDGTLRLFGMSKYQTYKLKGGDIGSFLGSLIAPPYDYITNAVTDVKKLASSPDVLTDLEKSESTRSVPIVGKLWYWWFGKGATKTEDSINDTRVADNVDYLVKTYEEKGKDAALAEYQRIGSELPELKKRITDGIEEKVLGLTAQEKRIRSLGVQDGERAKLVYKTLMRLKTDEERATLWSDYKKKKILSKEVEKQVRYLIENEGKTN